MAVCHTVALLLPRPDDQFVSLLYRLLTSSTHGYVAVEPPEGRFPMNGWQVRLAYSSAYALWELYLCRGAPFAAYEHQPNGMADGQFQGYISTFAMMMFYYHVFRGGYYVEVLACSEGPRSGAVLSDLFVRVPYVSSTVSVELDSHYSVNGQVFRASFYSPRPRCVRHMQMNRLPIMQDRALRFCDWDEQMRLLRATTSGDLYDMVYRFGSTVCNAYYNDSRPFAVGEPAPAERDIADEILDLMGSGSYWETEKFEGFYAGANRACLDGPARLEA